MPPKKPGSSGTVDRACNGTAFCEDPSTKGVCKVEDGIRWTDLTTCTVGGCAEGKCGSCSSDTQCQNANTICRCKDGANVAVPLSGRCSDRYCVLSLTTGAYCSSHGGPD